MRAFIMIECEAGCEKSAFETIKRLPWVISVHPLFGEYDFIVRAESKAPDDLASKIVTELRAIPGIVSTRTYLEASFGGEPVEEK
jgi:DNA-binding Lrp family transcriptional regulator